MGNRNHVVRQILDQVALSGEAPASELLDELKLPSAARATVEQAVREIQFARDGGLRMVARRHASTAAEQIIESLDRTDWSPPTPGQLSPEEELTLTPTQLADRIPRR